jgi:hypothetical protein
MIFDLAMDEVYGRHVSDVAFAVSHSMMTRRTERVIAATAVSAAVLLALTVLIWRVVYDDAPWSFPRLLQWPKWDRWGAFAVYLWVQPFGLVAGSAMIVAAIRRRTAWLAPAVTAIISIVTALLYLPLWFQSVPIMDRVKGAQDEPVHSLRMLVVIVMLTLALSALHVVWSREIASAVILNATLLLLVWLPVLLPIGNRWSPLAWQRPELLVAARPCRGALLWQVTTRSGMVLEVGTIDDIWSRFADPRRGRAPTRAISVRGDWRAEYYWFDASDLRAFHVRVDDPAVIHCDERVRSELVAPAGWHTVGIDW